MIKGLRTDLGHSFLTVLVPAVSTAGGASIVAFERDVRAYLGSTVTLRCDSSGFEGRIGWSRPDAQLPERAVADDTSLT